MSATTLALRDTATMLRRNLRRTVRYPYGPATSIGLPVVFLLLFVYVFGDTLGAGLAGPTGGRDDYLDYIIPGILLLSVVGTATTTPVSVAQDMTEGIMDRFRTMAISRASVLAGHVIGSVLQTLVALALIVVLALLLGFSPDATVVEWLAAMGLLALVTLAMTWLAVAFGMVSDSVETASNVGLPLSLLPFLGSGFVPTDSLPTVMRWFAEYQPFTPIMETVRGLLLGSAVGGQGAIAVAWAVAIGLLGWRWSRRLFHRERLG